MCGIVGFTSLHAATFDAEGILRRMIRPLTPRGPDGEGFHLDEGIAMGSRRLGIIDPVGGSQPMLASNGRFRIVYNGEVYNYVELRANMERCNWIPRSFSDTEVVLQQYVQEGAKALERFNGMFAFAIWDRDAKRLFLAQDRIGIKPLYYCLRDGELIFASELKAMLQHPRVDRRLNLLSVSKYFTYGYVPSPHTIFEDVHKLEPGSYLVFDRKGLRKTTYWDIPLNDNPPSERNAQEWAENLLVMLRDSVAIHMRSDVPVGVFLSGGIDSSVLTALAAEESPNTLHTFCVGFDQPSYNESVYAKRVASFFDTKHHEEILTLGQAADLFPTVMKLLDEPLADASIIPTYVLSKLAAQYVKVALGGEGGDELFAGYPSFQAHKVVHKLSFVPLAWRDFLARLVRHFPVSHRYTSVEFLMQQFLKGLGSSPEVRFMLWMGFYDSTEKKRLFSVDLQHRLSRDDAFEDISRHILRTGLKGDFQRLQYLCMKLYLSDDILVKLDRAGMANSLEARVPYLDRNVVEYACRIQPHYKLKGLTTKHVLKRAAKGLVPDDIINRRKAGFMMPVAAWLIEMRDTIEELCSDVAIRDTGLFDASFVRQMFDEHLQRRRDHRKLLYPLLCFMAWRQNYAS
jgi:asparagine synthase (glutamine-hydrolysing)